MDNTSKEIVEQLRQNNERQMKNLLTQFQLRRSISKLEKQLQKIKDNQSNQSN